MAKSIKDLKGSFDFTGMLVKKELKKNEDNTKNGKFTFHLLDKDLESEVRLEMWEGSDAGYWDNQASKYVKVTENIPTVMKEVRANATGSPFGIKVVAGGKEVEYFVNNDVIGFVGKLADNKYKVNVTGGLSFKTYKGKVYREYRIERIEVGTKKPDGFNVKMPVVISDMSKDKVVYGDQLNTLPILVKAKLEEGGYGHRAITLGLNQKHFLGGLAISTAKQLGVTPLEVINDKVLPPVITTLKQCKGYTSAIVIGRLKVGEITKKPTIDDLNPMEKTILLLQGEKAIQDRLEGMELITEYFDSLFLHSFDVYDSRFFEEISESELKLPSSTSNSEVSNSNPMLDAIANLVNNQSEENKVEVIVEEKVEVENKSADVDELANLVATQESEVTNGTTDFDESEFPF